MSRNYDKEFKLNAVKLVLKKKLTCTQGSQDLGIGLSSLQRWLHEVEKHSKNNAFPGSGNLRVEDDELRYLKREIDVLRRERDILKKALANSTGHDNTSSRISAGEEDFNVFLGLSFNCLAI